VNRSPLGWGAYVVDEWQPGAFIRLRKNPHYFRADEGLPAFDFLTYKITNPNGDTNISNLKFNREPFEYFNLDIGDFYNEIRENGCDLISTTADMRDQLSVLNILTNYYQDPSVNLYKRAAGDQDILFFNLRDAYESFNPGLSNVKNSLAYPELRTAISFCMNSESVNEKVFYGLNDITPEWTLIKNPIEENSSPVFNPDKGSEMLEAMGWIDHDGDKRTGRIALGFHDIQDGSSLTFSYLIIDTKDDLAAAYIYKESLTECGIDIIIKPVPADYFWNPAFDTSIFRGFFDLAQVKWSTFINNPCPLITSTNIPNEQNGYAGLNFSALSNPFIDVQCAILDESAFKYERELALDNIYQIIEKDKSMLKLYAYHEILVTRTDFCGTQAAMETGFFNIEEFDYGVSCQ
jgi:peptide/nickel transport system substrate-binding protein